MLEILGEKSVTQKKSLKNIFLFDTYANIVIEKIENAETPDVGEHDTAAGHEAETQIASGQQQTQVAGHDHHGRPVEHQIVKLLLLSSILMNELHIQR